MATEPTKSKVLPFPRRLAVAEQVEAAKRELVRCGAPGWTTEQTRRVALPFRSSVLAYAERLYEEGRRLSTVAKRKLDAGQSPEPERTKLQAVVEKLEKTTLSLGLTLAAKRKRSNTWDA